MQTVDLDQTLHSVASDLGLHCLPMSLKWDASHKWVKKMHMNLLTNFTNEEKFSKGDNYEIDNFPSVVMGLDTYGRFCCHFYKGQ